ncbi:hypothetical protein BST61_g5658 [Cercospora zeina]
MHLEHPEKVIAGSQVPPLWKCFNLLQGKISWGQSGGARNDFRSDVITRPSLRMLAAMAETRIGDDVFREDTTTSNFESHVANITRPASWNDSERNAICTQSRCAQVAHGKSYPRENTSGGVILPLDELRPHCILGPTARCQKRISTELDSSEAVAGGAGSLKDYCELVDLVCLDLSKNLGAPMGGAMVVGDFDTIRSMRRTRRAIGGGMRQGAVITAAAQEALFENFGRGPEIEIFHTRRRSYGRQADW